MNLSKKAFALFLLASLTAGQAQASDTTSATITSENIGKAVTWLLNKGGDKVIALIEKEDLARVIGAFGLSGICAVGSYVMYEDVKCKEKYHSYAENIFAKLGAATALTLSAMLGIRVIELTYNA